MRFLLSAFLLAGALAACGDDGGGSGNQDTDAGPFDSGPCMDDERFFAREVWSQTLERKCLGCHNANGLAAGTGFILKETSGVASAYDDNFQALQNMAVVYDGDDRPLFLRKPSGDLGHGGGRVIDVGDEHYQRLEAFYQRLGESVECENTDPDLLDGVSMETPYSSLRRFAIRFGDRLPTSEEIARVDQEGEAALPELFDGIMQEEAFAEIVAEGFNDIFLTVGANFSIAGLGTINHPTLLWFTQLTGEERTFAHVSTRHGIIQGANQLLANIVREDEPFTNILLADYAMVNPFSARSFGVFDDIDWDDSEDPNEFHPAKLHTRPEENPLPHAGILNSYIYLDRYQSTPTNVNRARARAFLLHFLGTDILKFASVSADPLAIIASYENPLRDAADCAVCHVLMDPIAGLFRNYQTDGARYPGPVPENTFPPGYLLTADDAHLPVGERTWSGGLLPEDRYEDALLWLGEQTVADPRFVPTMVSHFYRVVIGRPILSPPTASVSEENAGAFLAYEYQQAALEEFAEIFVNSNYNSKTLIRAIAMSPYYRARFHEDANSAESSLRYDLGSAQIMTPEQLHRKIRIVFGDSFQTYPLFRDGLMDFSSYRILYGGIDSTTVTQRLLEPNGVMAGVQQLIANNVSCRQASREFDKSANDRLLLGGVELSDFGPGSEAKIRESLVHIHERVLGERVASDSPQIDLSYDLFRRVQERGAQEIADRNVSASLRRPCEAGSIEEDPNFVVRAWAAVLNYQIQSFEFLYQ